MTESGKCKICTHRDRELIERLLLRDVKYKRIIEAYPELNAANLSTHRNKHLAEKVIRQATIEYEETSVREKAEELAEDLRILDKIIQRGMEDLVSSRVSPKDIIAALKVKSDILRAGDGKKKRLSIVDVAGMLQKIAGAEDAVEKLKEIDITAEATDEPTANAEPAPVD